MEITDVFEFKWGRDSLGHELRHTYAEPLFENPRASRVVYSPSQREWINEYRLTTQLCVVRKSEATLIKYSPLQIPAIYEKFLDADTPEKMVKFVDEFGLPYSLEHAGAPLGRLERHRIGLKVARKAISDEIPEKIKWSEDRYLFQFEDYPLLWSHWPFESEEITSFSSYIELDESITPRFRLRPHNLMSAMWLQLALDLERKATFKKCERCGRYFEYGAGTGRRKSAKYCKESCRVAAYYARARKNAMK